AGGTFIMQTDLSAEELWAELPEKARKTIREKKIRFYIVDAFAVAKKHAPTPELETRMMGIAFIGAVAGHVDRVAAGASNDAILEKIKAQISKKFGSKGVAVVEGNMAVIREGIEATHKVNYDSAAFTKAEAAAKTGSFRGVAISASMCRAGSCIESSGFGDRGYYDEIVAGPFREGTIADAPVIPGTGLFMPAGTSAMKDKGLFRRTVPVFSAETCTGCMECTLVCPDAAIPNNVHDIHELLTTAIRGIDVAETQKEAMRGHVYALSEAVREMYRQSKEPRPLGEMVAEAATMLDTDKVTVLKNFGKVAEALAAYPVAKTRPFFDAMEKSNPGSGGLYAVNVDPWKCTGCLECVAVCGPGALAAKDQDNALLETLQARFEFMSRMPNTPARFTDGATKADGEIKRLMLDRTNYYATNGGHGACRGCGEVTAIRLMLGTNRAIFERRRRDHIRELEGLIERLNFKQSTLVTKQDNERRDRIVRTIEQLSKRLYLFESGPTGNGPAGAVIANSTGCSSVYASTFPFNCYNDPWVNSLFQDAQPLAKGLFEGITASAVEDIRALRTARLELDDAFDPEVHEKQFRNLSWSQFTADELDLMPTVMTIGGDGATYDIGFGALSRILVTDTPLKVLVLNTGVYSNTGGQASSASFVGQDSDLARIGALHTGKHEHRKELGLIASFHPNVFVCSTSTALQGHYLKNALEFLTYRDSPAVFDVYTPCQPEHGIGDDASYSHALMAVQSRMNPVFVHDPRRGKTLHDWFVLDGNPDPDKTWTSTTLEYLDEDGKVALMEMPLTPAHFALEENRFKKHFKRLSADVPDATPIDAYIDMVPADREGRTPFIWSVDAKKRLVRLSVSPVIVELVEERRKYWHLLQYLGGYQVSKLDASHRAGIESLRAQYEEAMKARESSIDAIARSMSELAASSKAPLAAGFVPMAGFGLAAPAAAAPAAAAPAGGGLLTFDAGDQAKCTNCKTCYQDLSELFEKTRIVVDGQAKEVGNLIAGALERVKDTPELRTRIKKVAANCDAEIIHDIA
ncbi:MAG TPA: 2-oxoacid:acceptor oxidoreductase family protein, partial [Rhodocyclaceae bacterium]